MSLSLLAAQVGIRRLTSALGGADDLGGLGAAMLGVLAQVEASQTRLLAIEQNLASLLDQRYTAALGSGSRLLEQAFLEDRPALSRDQDLQRADAYLVDASHSATTPMQRALVERKLFLTRVGMRDLSVARDSWRRLDVHVGDAIASAHARYEWPFDEAGTRIGRGEFGTLSAFDKLRSPDPRWYRATDTVKAEARASMEDLLLLLGDTMTAARLTGNIDGLPDGRARVAPGRIVLDVPLRREVRLGGVIASLDGAGAVTTRPGDTSGYRCHRVSAQVALSQDRSAAVPGWLSEGTDLDQESAPTPFSDLQHDVLPGRRLVLSADLYAAPDIAPGRMVLMAGGFAFSARLDDGG